MKKLITLIAAFALSTAVNAQPDNHSAWGVKPAGAQWSVVVFGGNLIGFSVNGFYPVDNFSSGGKGSHTVLIQIDGTNFVDVNQITKQVTPAGVCEAAVKRTADAELFLNGLLTEGKKYEVNMIGWRGLKEGRLDIMGRVPPNMPVIVGDVVVDGTSVKELLIKNFGQTWTC